MPTYHFDPSQVSKFLRSAEIDVEEAKELFKRSNFDVDAANEFLKRSIEEVAEAGAVDIALGMAKQVSIIKRSMTQGFIIYHTAFSRQIQTFGQLGRKGPTVTFGQKVHI